MAEKASINDFIAAFNGKQPLKANRFRVLFNSPIGISSNFSIPVNTFSTSNQISSFFKNVNGNQQVDILCHTCTLPSRDLVGTEIKQYGPPHRMPITSSYMPVSFSFYSPSDMAIRRYFEVWQTAVVNINSNTFNFYNEYIATIRIDVYDSEGNTEYGVMLFEAWPSNISPIDFSYANENSLQNIMVTMQYRYWQNSTDSSPISMTSLGTLF